MAVSRIRKRIPAYAVLLFLIILTIPTTRDVLSQWWEEYGISLFWLRDLFCLIPPDTEAFYDPLYGLPLEGYRMAQGLLWIAASLGICLWKTCSGRKIKAAVVAAGALSLACVFQIEDKGSVNLQYERPDSASAGDVFWYAEHEGEEKAREADFSVARYDMAFELKKELAAQVKMTIRGGEGQSEYPFTLYHGYRVVEVTNGAGEEMDYEQEGDYVTVRGASDGTICFRYRGHSPIFYSNKNACFLPGFFPYYPRAGFRKICDLEWNNGTLYCQEKDEAAEFFVTVEGACGLMTNLAETADGWEGTASDVILLGGFYERDEAGNITYPLFEQSRDIMKDILAREDTLRQAAEAGGESAQEKPVILIPTSTALNSYLNGRFESSNYVLVGNAFDYSSVNGEEDSDD